MVWRRIGLFLALTMAIAIPSAAGAQAVRGGSAPGNPAVALVGQYFDDIAAHRFRAAWHLEAPCSVSWTRSNGPGAPVGSAGLPGRGQGGTLRLPYLRAFRVDRITRFHTHEIDRLHLRGVHVTGWFHWVYPPPGPSFAGNDEFPDGNQTIPILVRRCGGRWWIDPGWVLGGQPIP